MDTVFLFPKVSVHSIYKGGGHCMNYLPTVLWSLKETHRAQCIHYFEVNGQKKQTRTSSFILGSHHI